VNSALLIQRVLAASMDAEPLERCLSCGEPSSGKACRRCEMVRALACAFGEGRM